MILNIIHVNVYATAIHEAFGNRPFSPAEVSLVLGMRSPASTLSRLKTKGEVELVARGTYRAASKGLTDRLEAAHRKALRHRILAAPLGIALDGPDAVEVWTRGRYSVGRTPWDHPMYVAVEARDRPKFETLLRELKIRWDPSERPPRARGLYVIARFAKSLPRSEVDGTPVVDRTEVSRLIRENPLAYEGAAEWIRE